MAWRRLEAWQLDSLHTVLETWTAQELNQTLKTLGTRRRPTRKADLVALMESELAGQRLQERWQALSPLQQAAVAAAVHSPDGVFDADRFAAGHGSLPQTKGALQLFLFPSASGLAVPRDLRERLREFVPPPPAPELATLEELPTHVNGDGNPVVCDSPDGVPDGCMPLTCRDTELEALTDLPTVLRLVAHGAVSVSSKTRRPSAATMRALSGHLIGGDFYPLESRQQPWQQVIGPMKAFAWPMLLQAGGLAKVNGTRLALTRAGQAALTRSPAEVLRDIWQGWLRTRLVDEFNRIDVIRGQTGNGKRGMTDPTERRLAVEDALRDCEPNAWVALTELSRYMQAAGHTFEVTRNPWTLYIAEARYGSLGYAGSHAWSILQERYLRCLLFEYAATLGMVEAAYIHPADAKADYHELWGADDLTFFSRYDGLVFLRLTALGAYCLGFTDSYTPTRSAPVAPLSVLPDLTIVQRDGPLSPAAAVLLESWAVPEHEGRWRLDLGKAVQAVASGRSTGELRELLEAADDQPLPERVEGLLARAERQGQALKIAGAATLIECVEAELAALIATHAETRALCLRAGDRHLVVRAESESAFRKAVHGLGYGVALRGADGENA